MIERLDERLGARYAPNTRRAFRAHARRFLAWLPPGQAITREVALAYLDNLIAAGYRASTITDGHIPALRALLDANDVPWPLTRRDLRLGLDQADALTPTLSDAEVVALIVGVRGQPGHDRLLVALSSIYGLRASELATALATCSTGRQVVVQTEKAGRRRSHVVPPFLEPIFAHAPTVLSTRTLDRRFEALLELHVRPPRPREGWHAVRRALVSGLYRNQVSEPDIHTWMGWRTRHEIARAYYHPDPIELDLTIYRAHPYLRVWLG